MPFMHPLRDRGSAAPAVSKHLVRGPLRLDLAETHDISAIGDGKAFPGILLDQENGETIGLQTADHLEHLIDDNRSKTERRLIEQQHFRARHQRAGDHQHLLFATGQGARRLPRPLCQDREALQQRCRVVRRRRQRPAGG